MRSGREGRPAQPDPETTPTPEGAARPDDAERRQAALVDRQRRKDAAAEWRGAYDRAWRTLAGGNNQALPPLAGAALWAAVVEAAGRAHC